MTRGYGCLRRTDVTTLYAEATASVKRRLKVEPIMLNVPSSEASLTGLIDLTQMMFIDYGEDDLGRMVSME